MLVNIFITIYQMLRALYWKYQQARSIRKLQNSYKPVQVEIGSALVPALEDYARALIELADLLDEAPRTGWERDIPEGARTVVMSDTQARKFSARICEVARRIYLITKGG